MKYWYVSIQGVYRSWLWDLGFWLIKYRQSCQDCLNKTSRVWRVWWPKVKCAVNWIHACLLCGSHFWVVCKKITTRKKDTQSSSSSNLPVVGGFQKVEGCYECASLTLFALLTRIHIDKRVDTAQQILFCFDFWVAKNWFWGMTPKLCGIQLCSLRSRRFSRKLKTLRMFKSRTQGSGLWCIFVHLSLAAKTPSM